MRLRNNFEEKLAMGIAGEDKIYPWLTKHNDWVEDCRRQKYKDGGGPRMIGTKGSVVIPDFIVYNELGENFAVDAKVKKRAYLIDGKFYFTVDKKFEDYQQVVKIKKLDYMAIIFIYNSKMYFYKDSDLSLVTAYNNQYSTGNVYCFEYNNDKVVY
jgi:hypothetical protein